MDLTPAQMRERLGLTQVELAEKADLSPPTVVAIESGAVRVRMRSLERMADVLGVPASELLAAAERVRKGAA